MTVADAIRRVRAGASHIFVTSDIASEVERELEPYDWTFIRWFEADGQPGVKVALMQPAIEIVDYGSYQLLRRKGPARGVR